MFCLFFGRGREDITRSSTSFQIQHSSICSVLYFIVKLHHALRALSCLPSLQVFLRPAELTPVTDTPASVSACPCAVEWKTVCTQTPTGAVRCTTSASSRFWRNITNAASVPLTLVPGAVSSPCLTCLRRAVSEPTPAWTELTATTPTRPPTARRRSSASTGRWSVSAPALPVRCLTKTTARASCPTTPRPRAAWLRRVGAELTAATRPLWRAVSSTTPARPGCSRDTSAALHSRAASTSTLWPATATSLRTSVRRAVFALRTGKFCRMALARSVLLLWMS